VSGETYVTDDDQVPGATEPGFWTELDLRPVFGDGGATEDAATGRVCAMRGTLSGVRWLSAYADLGTTEFLAEHDIFSARRYVEDRDGVARSPGVSAPSCLRVPETPTSVVNALGTSLSGHTTTVGTFDLSEGRRLVLSDALVQIGAEDGEGADPGADDDGLETRLVFTDTDLEGVLLSSRGSATGITSATVDLTLTRGATSMDPDRFDAAVSIGTSLGTVLGRARGEAILVDATWQLRGRLDLLDGGTWDATQGAGGFTASLLTGDVATQDEELRWRSDAVLAPPVT